MRKEDYHKKALQDNRFLNNLDLLNYDSYKSNVLTFNDRLHLHKINACIKNNLGEKDEDKIVRIPLYTPKIENLITMVINKKYKRNFSRFLKR